MALAGPLGAAAGGLLVANQVLNNLNVGVNNNGDVVVRHNNIDAEVNLGNPVQQARRVGRYFLGYDSPPPDNNNAMDVVDQQVTPYRAPRSNPQQPNSATPKRQRRIRGAFGRLRDDRRWYRKFFDHVSNKRRKWRRTRLTGRRGIPWR